MIKNTTMISVPVMIILIWFPLFFTEHVECTISCTVEITEIWIYSNMYNIIAYQYGCWSYKFPLNVSSLGIYMSMLCDITIHVIV
jgi:hypothetical protein